MTNSQEPAAMIIATAAAEAERNMRLEWITVGNPE